jgi:actin-related protein
MRLRVFYSSFAAGKGSALVIDIGQTMASVTPVVDGFVLRKGLHQNTLFYTTQAQSILQASHIPHFLGLSMDSQGVFSPTLPITEDPLNFGRIS